MSRESMRYLLPLISLGLSSAIRVVPYGTVVLPCASSLRRDYSASISFLLPPPPPLPVPYVSRKEVGRDGGDCKVGSLCLEETPLASCYFCIPVNRVWNPICLFATASKLPLQPTSSSRYSAPRVPRTSLLRDRWRVRRLYTFACPHTHSPFLSHFPPSLLPRVYLSLT